MLRQLTIAAASFFGLLSMAVPAAAADAPATAYFLCKLIPPRATFSQTMSASEQAAMHRHVAYWTQRAKEGRAVVFGPIADPAGVWGLLILEARDLGDAQKMTAVDPAVTANIGMRYEIYPMIKAILRDAPPLAK